MIGVILFGVSCGLLYIAVRIEFAKLRDLCRRCAVHLNNENHCWLKDPEMNLKLIAELERAGWTEGGKER